MKFTYLKNVVTLKLDQAKCNGCGMCLKVCPQQVFTLENKVSEIVDRDACMECGACARNCQPGAIYVRPGVGCAYAVIMDKLNIKSKCCGDACGCSLDNIPDH
ncbi:MAG: mercury methylation ferredoxin HgcB [Bacillota bacterium]|nr:mercury methylation ferredoxin HgcB [Bacillota bacterium]